MGRRNLPPEKSGENGNTDDLEYSKLMEGLVAALFQASA